MFRIFYAEKDATLYESVPTLNTGLDEILEVGKRYISDGTNLQKSRSIVKFDINQIQSVLNYYNVDLSNTKFILQLFTSHAKNLPSEYSIDAKILYDSWVNGVGYENSSPSITDGVTWNYPESGSVWTSTQQITNSIFVTGSLGGSWLYQTGSSTANQTNYNQSFFTQPGLEQQESFSYRPTDINMDVTEAVKLWISGSTGTVIDNNGFLLKFSESDEQNNNVSGYVRFFSRDTHTIYVPKLIMYWDDSSRNTSLEDINTDSYTIYTNLKKSYKDTEITKVRIYGRDKYPLKSATNRFPIQTVKSLPETTYYSILDAATDETIIPFDDIYTKVSCDNTGNYILLDMNGLMPERYYRIAFKIVDNHQIQFINDEYFFKVVR